MTNDDAIADAATASEQQTADSDVKGDDAPDTLDELLNSFNPDTDEPQTAKADKGTKAEAPPVDPGKIARLEKFAEQYEATETQREIETLVKSIKGDHETLADLPDMAVSGWLQEVARKDSRVLNAWMSRHSKPDQWQTVVKGLGSRMAKEVSPKKDAKLSADREAAAAAVRNRGTAPPETPAISNAEMDKMSDSDFDNWKKGVARGAA